MKRTGGHHGGWDGDIGSRLLGKLRQVYWNAFNKAVCRFKANFPTPMYSSQQMSVVNRCKDTYVCLYVCVCVYVCVRVCVCKCVCGVMLSYLPHSPLFCVDPQPSPFSALILSVLGEMERVETPAWTRGEEDKSWGEQNLEFQAY